LTFQAFVCEADSKIIGFAAVDKYASDAVQLTHLYVSGAYRMNGTGKALVNMILQSVGPNMEVGVLVSPNNLPALALYKSVGFQPVVRKGEYAGHGEHLSLVLRTTA
jgi:[ribosomal protein S18]-alanine N-acetyltransferase